MKIALAQLNPLIGDLNGNTLKIISACKKAKEENVNLLITPELSLWGYPPRDLLFNSKLIDLQWNLINQLVSHLNQETPHLSLLIGIAEPAPDLQLPKLFNSIALIQKNGWKIVYRKQLLPIYDVFDEKRYFREASDSGLISLRISNRTWKIGLTICEDLWVEEEIQGHRLAGPDPIANLAKKKIDLLLNLSASPFTLHKESIRQKIAAIAAKRLDCSVVYLNQVGGNDELIFDGSSFVTNRKGQIIHSLPRCKESISIWNSSIKENTSEFKEIAPQERLLEALILGLRDYVLKCGFNSALLGLSGGIDSALVSLIACAALGSQQVSGILMPSQWSSEGSIKDASDLAKRLGIQTRIIPISKLMGTYDKSLRTSLGETPRGLTAENLQARIRGTLLMAIANKQRHLLLSTGNKSELAVGYCTLYGDMNGGLSVIGDIYKTCVFDLCKWIDSSKSLRFRENFGLISNGELIGSKIRSKPPSAELAPDQLDSDSLPEYEILDPILKALIEERINPMTLIHQGYKSSLINKVEKLLKQAEFKRRQAPPMLKVSDQAFGSGWRIPIASM